MHSLSFYKKPDPSTTLGGKSCRLGGRGLQSKISLLNHVRIPFHTPFHQSDAKNCTWISCRTWKLDKSSFFSFERAFSMPKLRMIFCRGWTFNGCIHRDPLWRKSFPFNWRSALSMPSRAESLYFFLHWQYKKSDEWALCKGYNEGSSLVFLIFTPSMISKCDFLHQTCKMGFTKGVWRGFVHFAIELWSEARPPPHHTRWSLLSK